MDTEKIADRETVSGELAVDFWKLLKTCERMLAGLPEEKRKRTGAQVRFSASRLENHLGALEIELITFEGKAFGPELPAIAINADDFESADNLIVESAIEPAVIICGRVIQNARVMLKERDANVPGN
jgi:hypothetical protein